MIPSYVKPKPWILSYLPFVSKQRGTTIFQTIYLNKDLFRDLLSKNPHPRSKAILEHELTHYKRIKNMGNFTFAYKYLLSGSFRFNEELIAQENAFRILKANNLHVDIEKVAKTLSGWVYLWPVPYNTAKQALTKAWNNT